MSLDKLRMHSGKMWGNIFNESLYNLFLSSQHVSSVNAIDCYSNEMLFFYQSISSFALLSMSFLFPPTHTHIYIYICVCVCVCVCMCVSILNKSWRHHPTRHQLYGHLPPITKTIQARRTRHAGHCWRSKDELISDLLLRTPAYGQAKAGRPARTYIQQLCEDTGCNPKDLPKAMNDREEWRERVRDIRAGGMTWWWWWNVCVRIPYSLAYFLSIEI